MQAMVMSGAANFGAMQAGALEVLLEAGFNPQITVGSSAGALNAIFMASNPTPEGARELQSTWLAAGPDQVGVPKPLVAVRRLVSRQDGLVASEPFETFLHAHLPSDVETFGQLAQVQNVRGYAVAVCMETAKLRVFGDHENDRLIDGAMASTAIPPYFPPWNIGDRRYLDGGIYAKLPILVALERGATQVFAIDVSHAMGSRETANGIMGISGYALSLMVEAQTEAEIARARTSGGVVRVLHIPAPVNIPFWDYTQAERLIRIGREVAAQDLAEKPLRHYPTWWLRIRRRLAGLRSGES